MSRTKLFVLLTVLTFWVNAELALAQVAFELKLPDDQKSTSVVTINSKQSLKIAGMTVDNASDQELRIATTNGKRGADGIIRQEQKIESLKAKLTLPGGVVLQFDSSQANPILPGTEFDVLLELIKVHANASWTVIRAADNRVVAIEGREKVLEGLDETKQAMLKKQIDPIHLRDKANKELEKLPRQPVNKGDSWEVVESIRIEQGQFLTFKNKFTYQGPVDRKGRQVEFIDAQTTEVTYGVDADSALPLKVMGAELKPEKSQIEIYFDREKGMVVESRSMVNVKGTITFEVNEKALPAELDLTMSTSTVTE